jgi:hypothetical protein
MKARGIPKYPVLPVPAEKAKIFNVLSLKTFLPKKYVPNARIPPIKSTIIGIATIEISNFTRYDAVKNTTGPIMYIRMAAMVSFLTVRNLLEIKPKSRLIYSGTILKPIYEAKVMV